jgi:hypothetical protein
MSAVRKLLAVLLALMIAAAPLPLLGARRNDGTANNRMLNSATRMLSGSTGPWTISFWFKATNTTQTEKYIASWMNTAQSQYAIIGFGYNTALGADDQKLIVHFSTDADARFEVATVTDTNWHHYTIRKLSAAGLIDYTVDGGSPTTVANTDNTVFPTVNKVSVFRGPDLAFPGSELVGDLEDFAVWGRALTDHEVDDLAAGTLAGHIPDQSGRVAYWPMSSDSSTAERDMWGLADLSCNGILANVDGQSARALHMGDGWWRPLRPGTNTGFNAAITAYNADTNGRGIDLGGGTHSISERIQIGTIQGPFVIRGKGVHQLDGFARTNQTLLTWTGGSGSTMFQLTGCKGIVFQDMRIAGGSTAATGIRVATVGGAPATDIGAKGVMFTGFTHSCFRIGADDATGENNNDYMHFEDVEFRNSARGFFVPNGATVDYSQSLQHSFIKCGWGNVDTAVEIGAGGAYSFWGCTAGGVDKLLYIRPGAGGRNTGPVVWDGAAHVERSGNTRRWMQLVDAEEQSGSFSGPLTIIMRGVQMTANGNLSFSDVETPLFDVEGNRTLLMSGCYLAAAGSDGSNNEDFSHSFGTIDGSADKEAIVRIRDTQYLGSPSLVTGIGESFNRFEWEYPVNGGTNEREEASVMTGDR